MVSRGGLVVLDDVFEPLQGAGPQVGENLANRVEGLRVEGVEPLGALAPLTEQAGTVQYLQVVADALLGDRELPGDLTGR
jgi:hypothetical protein